MSSMQVKKPHIYSHKKGCTSRCGQLGKSRSVDNDDDDEGVLWDFTHPSSLWNNSSPKPTSLQQISEVGSQFVSQSPVWGFHPA